MSTIKIIKHIKKSPLKMLFSFLSIFEMVLGGRLVRKQKLILGIMLLGFVGLTQSCGRHFQPTCYKPAMQIEPLEQLVDTIPNNE